MKEQDNLNLYDDFLAHTGVDRLQKIISRYELLKLIKKIPGDIVECGVYKGSGIYTLAKLSKLVIPNSGRKIVGFDFFGSSRDITFSKKEDQKVLDMHDETLSDKEIILKNLAELGIDNVELVEGDVVRTTKTYAEQNLGFRIAMLYLDVDNYEGTLAILRNFYPLVTPGGIVVFDEYGLRGHGESDAVSEFFKDQNPKLKSVPGANTPTAYIVKEKF